MKKSPICKYIGMTAWLVTALVSINMGLAVFGYDFFATDFALMSLSAVIRPIYYIILASGLYSLYMMMLALQGKCGGCYSGKKSCKC